MLSIHYLIFLVTVPMCFGTHRTEDFMGEYDMNDSTKVYESCYEELGCITTNASWCNFKNRPVVFRPTPRHHINTTFMLYTRNSYGQMKSTPLNSTTINPRQFTKNANFIFIVHGYLSGGDTEWVQQLTRAILKRGSYNVIVVDWSSGANRFYPISVTNTRVVALEMIYLLEVMMYRSILPSPGNVHLIGHSLGAHICGYVGEKIKHIRRITGLDPAGPYFQNMHNFVKLDPSDADRVIVLHTDPSFSFLTGYGTAEPSGHIDIFANDMRTTQPGCAGRRGGPLSDVITVVGGTIRNWGKAIRNFLKVSNYTTFMSSTSHVSCSHSRSIDYFIEAISSKTCDVIPFECDFFADFIEGKCNGCGDDYEKCIKLDLMFNKLPRKWTEGRKFLFFTNRKAPFCVTTYSVTLKLLHGTTTCSGTFNVMLYSNNSNKAEVLKLNSGHQLHFEPNSTINTLTFSQKSYTTVQRVDFEWLTGIFQNIGNFFRRIKRQLVIEHIVVQNIGAIPHSPPIKLCPKQIRTLDLGGTQSFEVRYCSN